MTDTDVREGTGVQGRSVTSDFERDVKNHYKKMSREQVICDTYGHRWPQIDPDPDAPLPAGFRASLSQVRGYLDLEEICEVCGEVRHSVLARGFLGERVQRSYKRPKSTVKRPGGYYGSRGDAQWELVRRAGVRRVLGS